MDKEKAEQVLGKVETAVNTTVSKTVEHGTPVVRVIAQTIRNIYRDARKGFFGK